MDKILLDPFKDNKNHKYIEIINPFSLNGTLLCYFHFSYGFLFPLILLDYKLSQKYNITYIFNYSFGPLDKIIFSLNLNIKLKCYIKNYKKLKVFKLQLKPMDLGQQPKYKKDIKLIKEGKATFMTFEKKEIIFNWFMDNIIKYDLIKIYRLNPIIPQIIFVTRAVDKSYKSLDYKDKRFSDRVKQRGSERRNINNSEELFKFIKSHFKNKEKLQISFESLSIYYQYYLLKNCKILICQHGSAVGNMIFMNPGSTIIEVIQQSYIDTQENWFVYYSNVYKINHYQYVVDEKEDFFDIDITKFKKFLEKNNIY